MYRKAFQIRNHPYFDKKIRNTGGVHMEVTPGFEPGNQGFADPCLTTWLCHRRSLFYAGFSETLHGFLGNGIPTRRVWGFHGAGYEARTRYLHLGKVALYQMS